MTKYKTKPKTKAQLASENKLLLNATRAMDKTITQQRDRLLELTHELHESKKEIRTRDENLKQAVARETAELQEQAIIKAEAIDGLKDQVAALMERVRDLNRQLLDEKNARKKDSKEADEAVEELGAIKNKVWRELVDLQASYRELQAENARIKSLHASSMEFIGTHIHFLKANVQ